MVKSDLIKIKYKKILIQNVFAKLRKLDKKTSDKLGLQDGTHALLVNRLVWSDDIIFEYRQSIIRTEKCHYTVKLLRSSIR